MTAHAKPVRIQRQRIKGWRMPPDTVYVGRPSKWGNPFDFRKAYCCWFALAYGCRGDRQGRIEASVRAFRAWIDPPYGRRTILHEEQITFGSTTEAVAVTPKITIGEAPTREEIRAELRGKNLACWCPLDQPCHAEVLLEIANQ